MVKINHPHAAAFTCPLPTPSYFANAPSIRNHVTFFWVGGYEIDEGIAFRIIPNIRRLANEELGFCYGQKSVSHKFLYAIGVYL